MKRIESLRDLQEYGIDFLTSESCGLGMRVLCDVTANGEQLLSGLLGGVTLTAGSWNGANGAKASVMLPGSFLPDLAAYALLAVDRFPIALADPHLDDPSVRSGRQGLAWGMTLEEWSEFTKRATFPQWRYRLYRASGTASDGLRNRHEMTGRVL